MTVPKLRTVNRGGARYYLHPETQEKAVGVTSVLNMLPKEFLKFWAAKVVAEEAFDRFGVLSSYVVAQDREAAVKWLKTAHQRNTGAAAMKGTEIHEMVEAIIDQGGIPKGMPKAPPSVAGVLVSGVGDPVKGRFIAGRNSRQNVS